MTLVIVVKCPEGLVIASESRETLTIQAKSGGQPYYSTFDNATKILSFETPNDFVGAAAYGTASIGLRSPHSFLTEFENYLYDSQLSVTESDPYRNPLSAPVFDPYGKRLSVTEFAEKFSKFFIDQWNKTQPPPEGSMKFFIAGFDENEPYGSIFKVELPDNPEPEVLSVGDKMTIEYGGQTDFVDRLRLGYDNDLLVKVIRALKSRFTDKQMRAVAEAVAPFRMKISLPTMSLQDAVYLAIFFIRTTITAQKLTIGHRGCGGHIDVCTITAREGLKYIQRKQIIGEEGLIL